VATATTRAKNRAISDLIGAGEVSAEEMDGQRPRDEENDSSKAAPPPKPAQKPPQPAQRPATARGTQSPAAASESHPGESEKDLTISEFWSSCRELGYDTGNPKANAAICDAIGVADMDSIRVMTFRGALKKLAAARAASNRRAQEIMASSEEVPS